MKIATVRRTIVDGKRVFEVVKTENIPFNKIPGITEKLIKMYFSKYLLKKRKTTGKPLRFD